MKGALVGTAPGVLLQSARARGAVLGAALTAVPEQCGMHANDLIAETLLTRLCRPRQGFLDVGAHIGSVFARVRRWEPSVRIFAIEADADKARRLREKFPDCTVFECAAGEEEGEAAFFANPTDPGYSSLIEQPGSIRRTIRIRAIDELLPEVEIDVVKMDIEGAELGALRGSRRLVERCSPSILFESVRLGTNSLGYAPEAIWDWFAAAGYEVLTPDRLAHEAGGMSRDTFLDAHVYPRRTRNYFAIARSRRIEIRDRARRILRTGT